MYRPWIAILLTLAAFPCLADEPGKKPESKPAEAQAAASKRFEEMLKGVTLKGHFTTLGALKEPKEESYEIRSVKKADDGGDLWLFDVKYAGKEMVMPLPVKFAGNCPVVHMNEFLIPGLGTFSCNVVFETDRYAGTWSHGPVKGHLYGTISKTKP